MPAVFKPPGYDLPPGHTCYLAVTGPKTAFPGPMLGTMDSRRPRGVRDSYIIDGRTNTITVVEADVFAESSGQRVRVLKFLGTMIGVRPSA